MKKTEFVNLECKTCYGYGMWPDMTAPMGPMDASDGMPTRSCPECGKNPNPIVEAPEEIKEESTYKKIVADQLEGKPYEKGKYKRLLQEAPEEVKEKPEPQ
jgi:hypothetical protein